MEPGDIFADHMKIDRPGLFEPFWVGSIANCGDVVQDGVEPDVDGLVVVKRNLDPPVETFTTD